MLDRFDSHFYDFQERTFEGKITEMFLFSGVSNERTARDTKNTIVTHLGNTHFVGKRRG